jgi:hypothetical protein
LAVDNPARPYTPRPGPILDRVTRAVNHPAADSFAPAPAYPDPVPIPTSTTTVSSASPASAMPAAAGVPAPSGPAVFDPLGGILAFILPGLGHAFHGERRRGALVALGVLGLFFGGMLIGGIDVIDRRDNPIWFAGQALVGPIAFGVDYIHQNFVKVIGPTRMPDGSYQEALRNAEPDIRDADGNLVKRAEQRGPDGRAVQGPPGTPPQSGKSLGRMNELGTLFATIAGMLNLIAVLDAAFWAGRSRDA